MSGKMKAAQLRLRSLSLRAVMRNGTSMNFRVNSGYGNALRNSSAWPMLDVVCRSARAISRSRVFLQPGSLPPNIENCHETESIGGLDWTCDPGPRRERRVVRPQQSGARRERREDTEALLCAQH